MLVKHKASVFVSMPREDFSVAHHILSTTNHPLRKALLDNLGGTSEQLKLYRLLIREIENHLSENSVAEVKRSQLLRVAKKFSDEVTMLKEFNLERSQTHLSKIDDLEEKTAALYGDQLIADISNDQEVKNLSLQLDLLIKAYVGKITSAEKQNLLQQSSSCMEGLYDYLKSVDISEVPDVKKYAIIALQDFIKLFKLIIQREQDSAIVLKAQNLSMSGKKPSRKDKQASERLRRKPTCYQRNFSEIFIYHKQ